MSKKLEKNILKYGDLAYFASRRLFPKGVRDDVSKLYSFVRVVNYSTEVNPHDVESFKYIVRRWQALKRKNDFGRFQPLDDSLLERVLGNICYVVHRFECDPTLIDDFLKSVARDFRPKPFSNIHETMDYIHGSAEVIGVLMAKVMKLPNASFHFAKLQARSFEFMNLLRDIHQDQAAGRQYFPVDELKKFGLEKLDETNALKKPVEFKKFMKFQIKRYRVWQKEAEKGLQFVPRRMRIAIRTSIDMYAWMAKKIDKDPYLVFEKKIKPRRSKVKRKTAQRFFKA